MRSAELKLAEWHRLYRELAQAQSQLVANVLSPGEEAERLRQRIARLQNESEAALEALHAAIAAAKKNLKTSPTAPIPKR
jgi:hypothetical protein